MTRRSRHLRGFALLEAIVALAILAAAGLALFAALSQSIQMVNRADAARQEIALNRNLLAAAELINPMAQTSGSMRIGGQSVVWQARLLEPAQDNASGFLSPGYYQVGLYLLELRLLQGATTVQRLEVRKAGWKQVRQPPPLQ